jgi:hypothetical protein
MEDAAAPTLQDLIREATRARGASHQVFVPSKLVSDNLVKACGDRGHASVERLTKITASVAPTHAGVVNVLRSHYKKDGAVCRELLVRLRPLPPALPFLRDPLRRAARHGDGAPRLPTGRRAAEAPT